MRLREVSNVRPCESVGACQISGLPDTPGAACTEQYDTLNEAAFPSACELSCRAEVGDVADPGNMICDTAAPNQGGDPKINDAPFCSGVPTHGPTDPGTPPPNLLFLVSDDWGFPYYENTLHGSTVTDVWHDYFSNNPDNDPSLPPDEPNTTKVPNLRSLAEHGAYFPVAQQCGSVCAPGSSCILTGRHPKDFEAPPGDPNGVVMSQTIAHRLRGKYCSIKMGKVWQNMFLEDTTPAAGFDFDTGQVVEGWAYQPGRTKRSLEEGACLMRKVNASKRPFLLYYAPVIPHPESNYAVPTDIDDCYKVGDSPFYKLDGGQLSVLSIGYRRRQTYFDCGVGRLLKFLTDTPDERYASIAAKKLIDTTVIVYTTDNGKVLTYSKGYFTENGYRTPLIVAFFDRTDPNGADNVRARSYKGAVASVLDIVPTAIDFANIAVSPPLAIGPVPPLPNGVANVPPAAHQGTSLRSALTTASPPSSSAIRKYQMGHFADQNLLSKLRGNSHTYLRTQTYDPVTNPFDVSGMSNGPCRTALSTQRFACRYLQRPVFDESKCNQYLYNVVEDPDQDTNLLSTACGNQANACFNDPCRCLYFNTDNALPPPPGKPAIYTTLKCELVRWTRLDPSMESRRAGTLNDDYRGCAFLNTQTGSNFIDIASCTQ
jgi:hypothetical protein